MKEFLFFGVVLFMICLFLIYYYSIDSFKNRRGDQTIYLEADTIKQLDLTELVKIKAKKTENNE